MPGGSLPSGGEDHPHGSAHGGIRGFIRLRGFRRLFDRLGVTLPGRAAVLRGILPEVLPPEERSSKSFYSASPVRAVRPEIWVCTHGLEVSPLCLLPCNHHGEATPGPGFRTRG